MYRIMEEGFPTVDENMYYGRPSGSILVNQVSLADLERVQEFSKSSDTFEGMPTGKLLICKVYLGEEMVDESCPTYSAN